MTQQLHSTSEPTTAQDNRWSPELGGGALSDLGCHPIDFFALLTGREPEEVAAVAVRALDRVAQSVRA